MDGTSFLLRRRGWQAAAPGKLQRCGTTLVAFLHAVCVHAISATGAILVRQGLRANRRAPTKSKQEDRPSYIQVGGMKLCTCAIGPLRGANGHPLLKREPVKSSRENADERVRGRTLIRAAAEVAVGAPPGRQAQPQLLRSVRPCSLPYGSYVNCCLHTAGLRRPLSAELSSGKCTADRVD